MKNQFLSAAKKLFLLLGVGVNVLPALCAQEFGESCYYFLGDYPRDANPDWTDKNAWGVVQGLAHDRDHWFITQERKIWKIPVGHDLNVSANGAPGVVTLRLCDVANLCVCTNPFPGLPDIYFCTKYDHFGDPECYEFGGQTFLLVPVEGDAGGQPPAIALFRADSLAYVAHTTNLDQQTQAPWCAVDPQGNVYSSNFIIDNNNPIRKYTVNRGGIDLNKLSFTLTNHIQLRDESDTVMSLTNVQGGVITPSGSLLYLVSGDWKKMLPTDGIHVFDLGSEVGSARRVACSTRDPTGNSGSFIYEINNGHDLSQEAEGLTFWDLDDGRAPGISGQLHVLLVGHNLLNDVIFFKHYAGTLHVDRFWGGSHTGSLREPFNTVNQANNRIWDGGQIKIKSASYPETLTFSKHIKVLASGGPVTIGQ